MALRSIANEFPASAPEPIGQASALADAPFQARGIARERFGVREEEMRKQNRLRMLHMRHARHGHANVGFRLQQKRVQQGFEAALNFCCSIDDE